MITPKEKAFKLAMKFENLGETDNAKQCALIAVDEIINYCCADDVLFLHKVKEEIEKL